ncbi:hypothetical protein ABTH93_20970, partial [Acinetobacter baumannii]
RITPAELGRLATAQARLLDIAAALVRPGGTLAYVVCSLLDEEGPARVAGFLQRHPGWQSRPIDLPLGQARGPGLRLTP